ncbi:3-phenylpropionate/trans-cinnamate dioxygenase ferredoxin reductase subunit [Bradyrhizobium sp. GM24.11]
MNNDTAQSSRSTNNQAALQRVVVVGSGHAGVELAASLRQRDFAGRITLVGDDPILPYQKPGLSKEFHPPDKAVLPLRAESFYDANAIELHLGIPVRLIDRDGRMVVLADGRSLPYDHLILATGARNRLPLINGLDSCPVLELRTLHHARILAERAPKLRQVAIIGGGFIGLELASLLRGSGVEVIVIEAANRLMARVLSPVMSDFFRDYHMRSGTHLRLGATVQEISCKATRQAVSLANGTLIDADAIILAAGVLPNDELAVAAGLKVDNGIVVDSHLLSSDPSISAIGDCASFPGLSGNRVMRLESVQNAIGQARYVASRLTGSPAPYRTMPWFWSNQGRATLQIAGLAADADNLVVRGVKGDAGFSVFLYKGEQLMAVESVNKPADHMVARRLLSTGRSPPKRVAADPGTSLSVCPGTS